MLIDIKIKSRSGNNYIYVIYKFIFVNKCIFYLLILINKFKKKIIFIYF